MPPINTYRPFHPSSKGNGPQRSRIAIGSSCESSVADNVAYHKEACLCRENCVGWDDIAYILEARVPLQESSKYGYSVHSSNFGRFMNG